MDTSMLYIVVIWNFLLILASIQIMKQLDKLEFDKGV